MASPLDSTRDRLLTLLEQHEITRGVYVRTQGKHLVLGRQEPTFGSQEPEEDDRLRLTQIDDLRFGLSVRRHTGRWERTPFSGTIDELVEIMTSTMQHLLAAWP